MSRIEVLYEKMPNVDVKRQLGEWLPQWRSQEGVGQSPVSLTLGLDLVLTVNINRELARAEKAFTIAGSFSTNIIKI